MRVLSPTISTVLLFAGFAQVRAQTDWEVVKTFSIGGQGGWDYLTVDPETHRLYVPRTTHTMVIDAQSGKVIADIPGQKNTAWRWLPRRGVDLSAMAAAMAPWPSSI